MIILNTAQKYLRFHLTSLFKKSEIQKKVSEWQGCFLTSLADVMDNITELGLTCGIRYKKTQNFMKTYLLSNIIYKLRKIKD